MKMEVVCSWCGCSLGVKEYEAVSLPEPSRKISHGICLECLARELAQIRGDLTDDTNKNEPH